MKIIFVDIPSYPPPIAIQASLTNQFYQQKKYASVYFQQKNASLNRDIHPGDSLPYLVV